MRQTHEQLLCVYYVAEADGQLLEVAGRLCPAVTFDSEGVRSKTEYLGLATRFREHVSEVFRALQAKLGCQKLVTTQKLRKKTAIV
jgi:hypothetical protein